VDQGKIKLT